MKISIIGAGNVGSTTALRLAEEGIGEIVMVDVAAGLACGKAFDLQDARAILKYDYNVKGCQDIGAIKDSDIIVVTAGLARKPGMSREELLQKNALIIKGLSADIKKLAPEAIVIVVTNPLDLMTHLVFRETGFKKNKVLGMGASLDAARFANLIAEELRVPVSTVEACVIGSHGEGMLPLPEFTTVGGVRLDEFLKPEKIEALLKKTVARGAEIVSLLGSGSAYFAPSAAIASLVRAIAKDQKRTIGACAYLDGEYGIKGVFLGVPCRLGKDGIEKIVELDLSKDEKALLAEAAGSLRALIKQLPVDNP